MEASAATTMVPYIVTVNFAVVVALATAGGALLTRGRLTAGVPDGRQNLGEFMLDFFVNKARSMGHPRAVRIVAPFLATCFFLILLSNMIGMVPIPLLNYPPTAFFSVTIALALCAVLGTMVISGYFNGVGGAIKHLFWPNPLQFVAEVTDVLSLSLRLFGNIGGEYMTVVLVTGAVAYGIPLILHVLGLIPTFVQALVFTLLTTSFIAGVIHHEGSEQAPPGPSAEPRGEPTGVGPVAIEGEPAAADAAVPAHTQVTAGPDAGTEAGAPGGAL